MPTRDFFDSDSKVLFYTAGMLAGSTPMTEIFCEYLPFLLDCLSFWHTQRALGYLEMNSRHFYGFYFLDIHVVGEIIERK